MIQFIKEIKVIILKHFQKSVSILLKIKKMERLTIEDESEGEDKSEHNFKVENKLENKFANLQIEFANFGFRQQISAYFLKICTRTLYTTLLLVDMTSVFKKEDVFLLKL